MTSTCDVTQLDDALAAYRQASNATDAFVRSTYRNPAAAWEKFWFYCAFANLDHALAVMKDKPHWLGEVLSPVTDPDHHAKRVAAFAADYRLQRQARDLILDLRTPRAPRAADDPEPAPRPAILHRRTRSL
jgi:hypothetical protein